MCRNIEMYGTDDLDAYEAEVTASAEYQDLGLAAVVSNLIASAQDKMGIDMLGAQQELNRARFLIARALPVGDQVAEEQAAA